LKRSDRTNWHILLSPRNAERAQRLSRLPGVAVAESNQQVADRADSLVLAVRPQIAEMVLGGLRARPGQKVISLIAGLDRGRIAALIGADPDLICRAVPLPFVAQGRDATPVFPPDPDALRLFDCLGQALAVHDQKDFDLLAALSALMGSYFGLIETAAGWSAHQGLGPDLARAYLGHLFANLGQVLVDAPQDLATLRQDHSTQGGLNEQVWRDFGTAGGSSALTGALDQVLARIQGRS
jgi:pyrroline-5-carboxylate reductase